MPNHEQSIRHEVEVRGITRLCHFTQSRNLPHIMESRAVLASETLRREDLPINENDPIRLDGYEELISCSIEYPNAWFLRVARRREMIFPDWVVLELEVAQITRPGVMFSPVNAATAGGRYISSGIDGFRRLFEPSPAGSRQQRTMFHLSASPTDDQAEVLVPSPIELSSVRSIICTSPEKVMLERERLAQAAENPDDFTWKSSPLIFDPEALAGRIRSGEKIPEKTHHSPSYS